MTGRNTGTWHPRFWDDANTTLAVTMAREGYSDPQIAAAIVGATGRSVQHRLAYLRLKGVKINRGAGGDQGPALPLPAAPHKVRPIHLCPEETRARDAEVQRLWNDEKLTQLAISKRLPAALGTVSQIMRRLREKGLVERRQHGDGYRHTPQREKAPVAPPREARAPSIKVKVKPVELPAAPAPKPEIVEDADGMFPVDRMRAHAAAHENGCKYMFGEPQDHRYCGKQRRDVLAPYCPEHMAVCYTTRTGPAPCAIKHAWGGNGFVKRLAQALEEVM